MYAHIDGIVADKGPGMLVIDCHGVGYLLSVSGTTLSQAPAVGERMKCFTHLSVREDALELFGFATKEEKQMFAKLKNVNKVGPKIALSILSTLSVRELSLALVTSDANAISRAPGVGKKLAAQIILDLKDKVENEELTGSAAAVRPAASAKGPDVTGEAIEALMALGYQSGEAAAAVAAISPMPDKVDEVIRLALKGMVK
ncbi:MAG: Holliday junction branch migration protein RuvA [Clostridia bacterium]|nr:Holliday junction branch migration protein RuvA [Clostridia bacterium]